MTGPFEITVWRGTYRVVGRYPAFASALVAYATITDPTKQLVNVNKADSGRDGLTDEERDQVAEVAYAEELASKRRSA